MFAITVTYVIHSGREDEASRHFAMCIAPSRAEPGNLHYDVYRSVEERRRFHLFEEYRDEAAFEAHRKTAHFREHISEGIMTIMESRSADRCVPLETLA